MKLDDATNGEEAVFSAEDGATGQTVPRLGTIYPNTAYSSARYYCTNVSATAVNDIRTLFRVTAEYEIRPRRRPTDPTTSPTLEKPVWEFRSIDHKTAYQADWYGNEYINAAGTPLRAVEIDNPGIALIYERNEQSPSMTYIRSINLDQFLGWEALSVLCYDISIRLIYSDTGYQYYRVRYEFHYRPPRDVRVALTGSTQVQTVGGWITARLNAGLYTRTGQYTGTRMLDDSGNSVVEDQKLTYAGLQALRTDPANYLLFHDYKELTFGALNIVLN